MEIEEAKRKIEMTRLEKENAKREIDAAKKESDLEKSRIALEKLQLSWIKWNLTCIALGVTAYKFYYARIHDEKKPAGYHITGRDLGIFLISLGFITLLFATLQHKKSVHKLKTELATIPYSLSLRVSYFVMGFSVIVLLMVILRT